MAISKIQVVVVDVGQGQCTFVVINDDSSPPKIAHTLLFDCGSDQISPDTNKGIEWIAATLKLMDNPTIDLLVFSHSDDDHISKMPTLLEAYNAGATKELKILKTWHAGAVDYYGKKNSKGVVFNILNELCNKNYCASTAFFTPAFNGSQFNATTKMFDNVMWQSADGSVVVNLLVGNVVDSKPGNFKRKTFGSSGELKNRVSLVIRLAFNGHDYIICGDATNRTMGWVNWYFKGRRFAYVPMVTMPHHGSRSTGLNVSGTKAANDRAIETVRTFAKICNGRTATTSSFTLHNHPSMELVRYFVGAMAPKALVKDRRATTNVHAMVSYVDLDLKDATGTAVGRGAFRTYQTSTNLYGTFYFNATHPTGFAYDYGASSIVGDGPTGTPAALNAHASWIYSTDSLKTDLMYGTSALPPTDSTIFTEKATVSVSGLARHAAAQVQVGLRPTVVVPSLPRLRRYR